MKQLFSVVLSLFAFGSCYTQILQFDTAIVAPNRREGKLAFFANHFAHNGKYLAVGSYYDDYYYSNPTSGGSGSVIFYELDSSQNYSLAWISKASGTQEGQGFGYSIDANSWFVATGIPWDDFRVPGTPNKLESAGRVEVRYFGPKSDRWQGVWNLYPPDLRSIDLFGSSVRLKDSFVYVGAGGQDYDSKNVSFKGYAGAIYVFKLMPKGKFELIQKVTPFDRAPDDHFGAYEMEFSGNDLLISAHYKTYGFTSRNEGAVYYYKRDSLGKLVFKQKITPEKRSEEGLFGISLDVDGDDAIIGASNDRYNEIGENFITGAGAAYFFHKNAADSWVQIRKVVAGNRLESARFGQDVCIKGNIALIGSRNYPFNNKNKDSIAGAGAVYLYCKDDSGKWEFSKLITSPFRSSYANFGSAIFNRGNDFYIGAPWDNGKFYGNDSIRFGGAFYKYNLICSKKAYYSSYQGCDSVVDENGKVYFSTALKRDTFKSFLGCDSILVRNINISRSTYIYNEIRSCGPLISSWGKVYDKEGRYQHIFRGKSSCDTLFEFDLEITTIKNGITKIGETLWCNSSTGPYAWMNCDSFKVLNSADTNRSFKASIAGNYAVILSVGNCRDTSKCIFINQSKDTMNSFNSVLDDRKLKVYYSLDEEALKFGGVSSIRVFKVINIVGVEAKTITIYPGQTSYKLKLPTGIYILLSEEGSPMLRFRMINH